ncbi:hypothetical protein K438DRAFT_1850842 [Mycena galopus ATCC 62051]|nr:hypothetical protein K438DRAFT_1850842 [Mycena galopus ATCC 62051]
MGCEIHNNLFLACSLVVLYVLPVLVFFILGRCARDIFGRFWLRLGCGLFGFGGFLSLSRILRDF